MSDIGMKISQNCNNSIVILNFIADSEKNETN